MFKGFTWEVILKSNFRVLGGVTFKDLFPKNIDEASSIVSVHFLPILKT